MVSNINLHPYVQSACVSTGLKYNPFKVVGFKYQPAPLHIGKVVQKSGMRDLPHFEFKWEVARQYLTTRRWIGGLLMDVSGAGLQLVALASIPVSVVSPIQNASGFAIVVRAVWVEHIRLTPRVESAYVSTA